MWKRIKKFYEANERWVSAGALFAGFVLDNLTFQRIDRLFDALVLSLYLLISGASVAVLTLIDAGKLKGKVGERLNLILPVVLQFVLGGLFSAFFVFYFRSGALSGSWPFLLLLLMLLIGNERFRHRYKQFVFRTAIFFVALFSFSVSYLPVLFGRIGALIFILSGVFSLVLLAVLLYLLSRFAQATVRSNTRGLMLSIGGLYILLHVLYFTNLIPPIPLVLKDAGVYHEVKRERGGYVVTGEREGWLEKLRDPLYHKRARESVYVYTSIFAPTRLNAEVVHSWEYWNESTRRWVSMGKVRYEITGGADTGYKGYSYKSNPAPGKWRLDIETARGGLIGRVNFKVVDAAQPIELLTEAK